MFKRTTHFLQKLVAKNYVFIITFTAFLLYIINLKGSLGFFDDTARDTLRALEIVENKELTLIGPPLSFGLFSIREVYFGSLSLYTAAVGLLIGNLDATGAIYPIIFFFTLSIPFFHQLVQRLTDSKKIQIISILIYALSPVTVTFARFFWNPNLIIPFSVFYWLLLLRKYRSKRHTIIGYVFAGCIGGFMMNLHYISAIPIVLCILYFLLKRKILHSAAVSLGLFIGSIPLILFELKHEFYLTQALVYNLSHRGVSGYEGNKVMHFFSSFLVSLGLMPSEISHPTVNIGPYILYLLLNVVLVVLMITSFSKTSKEKRILLIPIVIMNLIAVGLSGRIYNVHYLFPVYPLFIWYVGHVLSALKYSVLQLLVITVMIYSSLLIPYDVHNIKKDYLSISEIEAIASHIVRDNPTPPYNITENITGGAQAIPFRYILQRDAKVQPNDKVSYTGLKTLYVVTDDINKAYKEDRWEFSATKNKVLTKTVNFKEVKLFKFEVR